MCNLNFEFFCWLWHISGSHFQSLFPATRDTNLFFFSGSSLNSAAGVWSGRPKPDRCGHGASGRGTIEGRIITDTDPACTSTEWHQAHFFQQLGPEKGWYKMVLFSCPESLMKWILPTYLLCLWPYFDKAMEWISEHQAVSARWRLLHQLNDICVHTCPSFTLALKQNHLAVPVVHWAAFHKSRPKRPSHTFKQKRPQDFHSK